MTWKLARIDWHSMGQCWTWRRARRFVYYSGNQVWVVWGRLAFVFERRTWRDSANMSLCVKTYSKTHSKTDSNVAEGGAQ